MKLSRWPTFDINLVFVVLGTASHPVLLHTYQRQRISLLFITVSRACAQMEQSYPWSALTVTRLKIQ